MPAEAADGGGRPNSAAAAAALVHENSASERGLHKRNKMVIHRPLRHQCPSLLCIPGFREFTLRFRYFVPGSVNSLRVRECFAAFRYFVSVCVDSIRCGCVPFGVRASSVVSV